MVWISRARFASAAAITVGTERVLVYDLLLPLQQRGLLE